MTSPSWVNAADGFGAHVVVSASAHAVSGQQHRQRSLSLNPDSRQYYDLKSFGVPARWRPDYTGNGNAATPLRPNVQNGPSKPQSIGSGLAPIPEDFATSHHDGESALQTHVFNSQAWTSPGNARLPSRRHSEGDLLGAPINDRFVRRDLKVSANDRKNSYAPIPDTNETSFSFHGFFNQGLSHSAGDLERYTENDSDFNDTKSSGDRDGLQSLRSENTQSTTVSGTSTRRKSASTSGRRHSQGDLGLRPDSSYQNGTGSAVKKVRRKSEVDLSFIRSDGGDRNSVITSGRRSTIDFGSSRASVDNAAENQAAATSALFASLEIPIGMRPHSKRLGKLFGPVIMCGIVLALAGSLGAAIYFAVVLNNVQDKYIEYLRATIRFHLGNSAAEKFSSMTQNEKDSFSFQSCEQVGQLFQRKSSPFTYRGCELATFQINEIRFLLYFDNPHNSTQGAIKAYRDDIWHVLMSSSTSGAGGDTVTIGSLPLQLSTADIQVEGISQAPSFFKNEETSAGQIVNNGPILQDSDGPLPNMVLPQASTTSDVLSMITTEALFYKTTRSKLMTSQTPSVSTESLQTQAEISYLEIAAPKQSVLMTSQSPSASSELLNTQTKIPYFQATTTTWSNFPTSQTQRTFYASTVNTALPLSFLQPPSIVTEVTDSVLDSNQASTTSIVTETLTSSVNPFTTRPSDAVDPLSPCAPGESETYYRYPGSCSIFFHCLNGRSITLSCGSQLSFDTSSKVCTTKTDCDLNKTGSDAVLWNDDDLKPCEILGGKYHPHPYACNMYIQCDHNNSIVRICPYSLVFNTTTQTCVSLTGDVTCPQPSRNTSNATQETSLRFRKSLRGISWPIVTGGRLNDVVNHAGEVQEAGGGVSSASSRRETTLRQMVSSDEPSWNSNRVSDTSTPDG